MFFWWRVNLFFSNKNCQVNTHDSKWDWEVCGRLINTPIVSRIRLLFLWKLHLLVRNENACLNLKVLDVGNHGIGMVYMHVYLNWCPSYNTWYHIEMVSLWKGGKHTSCLKRFNYSTSEWQNWQLHIPAKTVFHPKTNVNVWIYTFKGKWLVEAMGCLHDVLKTGALWNTICHQNETLVKCW